MLQERYLASDFITFQIECFDRLSRYGSAAIKR